MHMVFYVKCDLCKLNLHHAAPAVSTSNAVGDNGNVRYWVCVHYNYYCPYS